MSSKRSTKPLSRKQHRRNPAVKAIRERKAALPFQHARKPVQEAVDAGLLPPGCARVAEALARCHEEHGQGVAQQWLLIGYGASGQKERIQARKRSHAEPPVHLGLAEEAGLSRRWTIHCVKLIVAMGIVRKWFGGPKHDPRENGHDVQQRHRKCDGARTWHVHGIGGSGLANGYTVEGIPDPPYGGRPRPPDPEPEPPPWEPPRPEAVAAVREMTQGLARDGVDRQRRRLQEQEARRLQGEPRGP